MNRTGCLPSIPGISLKILVPGTAHNLRFARLVHNQESAADGLQSFTVAHSTSTGTRIEILSQHVRERIAFCGDMAPNQPSPHSGRPRRLLLGLYHGVLTTKKIFSPPTLDIGRDFPRLPATLYKPPPLV
jgi:hypothetical protein